VSGGRGHRTGRTLLPGAARYARPLLSPATYRRGVYLLLGSVLLLPYLVWAVATVLTLQTDGWRAGLLPLTLLVCGGSAALLSAVRSLEIAAVRLLLDAELPAESAPGRLPTETRLRSALWFALHLASGGLVGALAFAGFPLVHRVSVWAVPVYAVVLVYAVAGLGALATAMAPVLLGPSAAEQVTAAETRARALAERNRVARELHDSIGHALTATTLQAAAARRVFDTDPEFARRTLESIEEVGRAAATDLDHAIGVLRGDDAIERPAAPGLDELDRLCAGVRAGGVDLEFTETGPVADLPSAVSREAYRIVQEGLTNAVRHAGPGTVTVTVAVTDDAVGIELSNPVAPTGERGGGRGLSGIRERAALLGGDVEHRITGGLWQLAVRLPRSVPR